MIIIIKKDLFPLKIKESINSKGSIREVSFYYNIFPLQYQAESFQRAT